MLFAHKSSYPVGLDISDLSLKLVQLDKIRDKIKIQAIGKINLAKGIIASGEIKKKDELIKALKKLMANPQYGKVSSEEIVACLPESKTFIKLIEVDKTPNPIPEIIGNEIEKHFPLSINEIYYDWQLIKDLPDKYLILIGASPKNIVNQYSDMLDEAKLSTAALEIESIAICRCLLTEESPHFLSSTSFLTHKKIKGKRIEVNFIKKPDEKKVSANYAIIDVGANHTSMIFYSINSILFTVSMPISGEQITNSIAETLAINSDQAEKAKIICGLDNDKAQGIIKNILYDTIQSLIKKIITAIEFYNHYFSSYGPLNQLLLCGGGSNIKNIDKIIRQAISIEVNQANALVNVTETKEKFSKILNEKHNFDYNVIKKGGEKNDKTLSIVQDISLTYTTAIGLALRGIFIDEL